MEDGRVGAPRLELTASDWPWTEASAGTPSIEELVLEGTPPVAEWLLNHVRLFFEQVNVQKGGEYGLSSGKHSCLVLALLNGAGQIGHYAGAHTFGSDADTQVGNLIATHYGLSHRTSPWGKRAPGQFFEHMAEHVFATEGEVYVHDITWPRAISPRAGSRGAPAVNFTGHEGSASRKDHPRANLPESEAAVLRFVRESVPLAPLVCCVLK